MRIQTPRLAAAALATAGVLGLAACGGNSSSSASTTTAATTAAAPAALTAPAGPALTVTLSADPNGALKFDTTKLTATAGTVTVVMNNPLTSGVSHGIAVEGNGVDQDGPTVQPGGKLTDTLTLKPGTYSFYCPVPGHKQAGMKGTLVVS